jgi:2-hydroxychromene-2-carboxylate isomerase
MRIDAAALLARSAAPEIKERLRAATAEAEPCGIFGAPSFVAPHNELFWGDDRLEAAIATAANSTT